MALFNLRARVSAGLLAVTVVAAARAEPLFSAPYIAYDVGRGAVSVAIGDLDGDAIPDLAVANQNSGTISVLLGNGDGTFHAARDVTTGGSPASLAIADLNGDGRLDLVVAIPGGCTIAVLLGHGDGAFERVTDAVACVDPRSIAIADLDGDHDADLVAGGSTVAVIKGNGDGTFGAPLDVAGVVGAHALSVADLNGDGTPDLAIPNSSSRDPDTDGHRVSVLIGRGDGTFGPPTEYPTGIEAWSIAAGDVDGDGRADLAVACDAGDEILSAIVVLLGNGDGTFRMRSMPVYPYGPHAVAVADVNADGKPDLVTTNSHGDPDFYVPRVCVLIGNGDGTFARPVTMLAGEHPWGLIVGDLDRDGRVDIALSSYGFGQDVVSILHGNGDGSFGATNRLPTLADPFALTTADLDRDGRADLVWLSGAHRPTDAPQGDWISVRLGHGDGTFAAEMRFPSASETPSAMAIADLNGDGALDVAVTNYGSASVSVMLGNGDGTLAGRVDFGTGTGPLAVAVADLNADGRPDLAVGINGGPGAASVLLGNGDGTFRPRLDIGPDGNWTRSLAIADMNGDGHPDLAMTRIVFPGTDRNGLMLLLGTGDGTFAAGPELITGGGPKSISLADPDADGRLDLVLAYDRDGIGTISVFHGSGDGTFGPREDWSLGGGGDDGIVISDLDGDGRLDLVTVGDRDQQTGDASVLLQTSKGTFAPRTGFGCGAGGDAVATADFNSDGRMDLAVPDRYRTISILPGRGGVAADSPPETMATVPITPRLALEGLKPNPTVGAPRVAFTLADDAPARLEVLDVAGRRVFARDVGALGAGRHVLSVDPGRRLAAGLYLIRLSRGDQVVVARGVVTR